MGFRFLHKKEIDKQSWDACIASSSNPLPYALFDYLDITTGGNFGGLVEGDYESVFPVPLRNNSVRQPFMTQQLGVFSRTKNNGREFLQYIFSHYPFVQIKVHPHQDLSCVNTKFVRKRTNLILPLNESYTSLFQGFQKSLRKRLKKENQGGLQFNDSGSIQEVVAHYKSNLESQVKVGSKKYLLAEKLLTNLQRNGLGKLFSLRDDNDQILADGFFLIYKNRIINLFGSSSSLGKERNGMAHLLNHVIEKYSGQDFILDFEGSDIPGVKTFFRSFGAQEEIYYEIIRDKRSIPRKVWDKVKDAINI
ncbi:MAG: hypothetical protein HKN16_02025 [Saprospiraceae bacterium]|nr:hypothetical protein [Saprospiraceae bacterium]